MKSSTQEKLVVHMERLKELQDELDNSAKEKSESDLMNADTFYEQVKSVAGGQAVSNKYWEELNDWHLSEVFPPNAVRQLALLKALFVPHLPQNAKICDMPCACGDFTFALAPLVEAIDGYDLSPGMIEQARNVAATQGVTNAHFFVGDAASISFDTIYDGFMMLGLLTYLMQDEQAREIIAKVHSAMKPGTFLAIKDSVIAGKEDVYRYDGQYTALYRSTAHYMQLFHPWFKTVETARISEPNDFKYFSLFALFQRQDI